MADETKGFTDINTDHGTLTYYEDKAGEHRARTVAKNGNKLVATTEGYKDVRDAKQAMWRTYMILHSIYGKVVFENEGEPTPVPNTDEDDDIQGGAV